MIPKEIKEKLIDRSKSYASNMLKIVERGEYVPNRETFEKSFINLTEYALNNFANKE